MRILKVVVIALYYTIRSVDFGGNLFTVAAH